MTKGPLHSHRQLANSRWSMVTQRAAPGAVDSRSALVELCLRYWYPVYAYVRRCGHAPGIAQDIARSFLQHLFSHFRDDAGALTQARFRPYLLVRLNAFLAEDWRRSVDGEIMPELVSAPIDLEPRNLRDNAHVQSPGEAYQRSFALEVLARAFHRLRTEARQTGHLGMYESLQIHGCGPAPGQYEELAGNWIAGHWHW